MVESEYSKKTMEHFSNPKNVGEIKDADGKATVGDPTCGDFIQVWIKVNDDVITDYKYKVFGCGAAIATTSAVSEMVIGKSFMDARNLTDDHVVSYLGGLPEGKKHCSLLGIMGLHTAMADYVVRENHKKFKQRLDLFKTAGYDIMSEREFLVNKIPSLPRDYKILEIGTGKGHLAITLARHGFSCVSIDKSADEQYYAKLNAIYYKLDNKIDLQAQDATNTSFQDSEFDCIISSTALHHIPDTESLLNEIVRISRNDATILLSDFNTNGQKIVAGVHADEGNEHHIYGWDVDRIEKWFKKMGSRVTVYNTECMWILEINKNKEKSR